MLFRSVAEVVPIPSRVNGKPDWYLSLMKELGGVVWSSFNTVLSSREEETLLLEKLRKREKSIEKEHLKRASDLLILKRELESERESLKRKEEELEAFSAALGASENEFDERKSKDWELISEERERLTVFAIEKEDLEEENNKLQKRIERLEGELQELRDVTKRSAEEKRQLEDQVKKSAGRAQAVATMLGAAPSLGENKIFEAEISDLEPTVGSPKGSFVKNGPRTIRDVFEWFNVSLRSRTLARGSTSSTGERKVIISLEGEEIHREVLFDAGTSPRRYLTFSLNEDPRKLVDLFFPHSTFDREGFDYGIVEIMKLLGKPLSFPMSDNKYARTTEF